jgi:transcriptional regulator with XRE-family HTH domain
MATTPVAANVARRVKQAVEAKGITQAALSTASGLSERTLARRLAGTSAFDLDELHSIAAALGVDPESFLAA